MMQKSLSELAPEQLSEITKLAGLFFVPRQIAIMLQLSIVDFVAECDIETSPVYIAFYSGRLQREVDLREKIIKLAESGSSPAQTMAIDILMKSKIQMIDK